MAADHQHQQAPNDIIRELCKNKIIVSRNRQQMIHYQDKMMDLMRRLGVKDIKKYSAPELVTWLDSIIRTPGKAFEFINIKEAEVMSQLRRIHSQSAITTIWSLWDHTIKIRDAAMKAFTTSKSFFSELETDNGKARSGNGNSSQRPEKRNFSVLGGVTSSKSEESAPKKLQINARSTPSTSMTSISALCYGCGKRHDGECLMKNHPQWNSNSSIAFVASEGCQALRRRTDKPNAQRISQLPLWTATRVTDNWLEQDVYPNKEFKARINDAKKKKKQGTEEISDSLLIESLLSLHTLGWNEDDFLHVQIQPKDTKINDAISLPLLLDTGALQGNYVARSIVPRLINLGYAIQQTKVCTICTGLEECTKSNEKIELHVSFTNEITNKMEVITIPFTIIESSMEIIMGKPDIIQFDMIRKVPSLFMKQKQQLQRQIELPTDAHSTTIGEEQGVTADASCLTQSPDHMDCDMSYPSAISSGGERETKTERNETNDYQSKTYNNEQESARENEAHYQTLMTQWGLPPDLEQDDSEIPQSDEKKRLNHLITEDNLQEEIEALCDEFSDIFADSCAAAPADVPPMKIEVDETKWFTNKNRSAPRNHGRAKQDIIRDEITCKLKIPVIETSRAPAHSQVHMVPKPRQPGKWRMTCDFRALNECTITKFNWPIPNIKETLDRIGGAKAGIYGVIDLTDGYNQIPLDEKSRMYTAFITFMGLFQWLRVPMGLTGAGHYFQQIMATIVLVGLIHVICECFMDDIVVFARSKAEFLSNLRQIFQRLRERGIKVKRVKLRLGYSELETLGHTINALGKSFSREKIKQVVELAKPRKQKDLKQFLGLCNYFRDHVPNHSSIVHPLQKAVDKYQPSTLLVWTEAMDAAFDQIVLKIKNCPTLFWCDDDAPIFLQTDACEYGIGAYLFQVVDGKEQPIGFISKALQKNQLHWSTIEKEGFAIVFALKKWDYLLRDRYFTLRTDHMNLTYMKTETNDRVTRWYRLIQQFRFEIEHIPGKHNIVADTLSRHVDTTLVDAHKAQHKQLLGGQYEPGRPLNMADHYSGRKGDPSMPYSMADGFARVACFTEVPAYKEYLYAFEEGYQHIDQNQYKLLSRYHNSAVGHRKLDALLECVKDKWKDEWPSARRVIKNFIRQCPCCQKMSQLRIPIHTSPFTTSCRSPWQRVSIDSVGPLPVDTNGNRYVFVIIDNFSRWIELTPVASLEARPAAHAILQFCGRYGTPAEIVSDNGPQFVNQIVRELCDITGIQKFMSLSYSHEENAIVERANKDIMRHLRAIIFDVKLEAAWSTILPLVQRIKNASINRSIGVSPAHIIFGSTLDLDRNLFLEAHEIRRSTDDNLSNNKKSRKALSPLSEWSSNLLRLQERVIRTTLATQIHRDSEYVRNHSHLDYTHFEAGRYVLVQYPRGIGNERRSPNKLNTPLRGSLQVVRNEGRRYILLDLVSNEEEVQDITALQPFIYDPAYVNPKEVAMADNLEYWVEAVIDHRGDISKRKTLEFLVKWKFQDESKNSWEPYKNLRYVEALHEYLRQNQLLSLIPKSIQEHSSMKPLPIDDGQEGSSRMDGIPNKPRRRGRPRKRKSSVESQGHISKRDSDSDSIFEEPLNSEANTIRDHGKRKRQRNRNIGDFKAMAFRAHLPAKR